uniref:Cysteine protease n=1 Tax=Trifolium repens TaxID=3899 RepID=D3YBB8_TRIRP|nr:cysteine protease [Trifolium repens]
MTILKCLEYPCIQICSIDDTKVDIDWICTRSDLLLQPETNEHRTKTGQQKHRTKTGQPNTPYKDGKSKQANM